ncbi:hypothetical protein [Sporisorium scitamineum]|uniref:Uncharacterized protein n=1 Tax=Sporisorium scitamineum TaxID=49012 RepID=A0A0F7RU92_9BASI|nr:hypothetical protein [Sporisorium scitamineum]
MRSGHEMQVTPKAELDRLLAFFAQLQRNWARQS